jgi:hypothetical protein
VKTPTLHELHANSRKQTQLQQVQVNPLSMSDKVPTINQQATSGHKPPRPQQLLSSTNNAMNRAETAYVPETS